jgi:tRNA(fMet)-specific endonuclease VapC
MTYALDANIISYLLKDNSTVYDRLNKTVGIGDRCIIPPVAYYEVKRGLLAINAKRKERDFEQLCHDFGIGQMDTDAWTESARLYAELRRNGTIIDDADLFIAAFCLAGSFTLVTNNTRHFERIEGLRLTNWTEV